MEDEKNVIKRLPNVLFQVIQSYCSFLDYRRLLNCNKRHFLSIKRETIYYDFFLRPDRWAQIDTDGGAFLLHLINSVKDKSKQVSLELWGVSSDRLRMLPQFLQGLHHLSVRAITLGPEGLDFNLFNGISLVNVSGLKTIESISSGFENITVLQLSHMDSLTSLTNINQTQTLRKLRILFCSALTEISIPMNGVTDIEISTPGFTHFTSRPTGLTRLAIVSNSISTLTLEDISNNLSSLQYLRLHVDDLPEEHRHGSLFSLLPELHLKFSASTSEFLSFFYGKVLQLVDCSWTPSLDRPDSFLSLVNLELHDVHRARELPNMPALTKLKLTSCYDLEIIPELPQLKILHTQSCHSLSSIGSSPSLQSASINDSPRLSIFTFAAHPMQSLTIRACGSLFDVSMLREVKSLRIESCDKLTSLKGLAGPSAASSSDLEREGRRIALSSLNGIDISDLHHIHSLELCRIGGLNNFEGLHSINHLVVRICFDVVCTVGLRDIHKSFTVQFCPSLVSIVDLNGIPHVAVEHCKNVENFSVLGENDTVTLAMPEERREEMTIKLRERNIKRLTWKNSLGSKVYDLLGV